MSIKLKNTNSSLVHLSQFCSYISQFYLIYLSSLYYTFPYTYLISLVNYLISLVLFTSVLYFNPSLYFSRSLVLPELSQFFILIASVLELEEKRFIHGRSHHFQYKSHLQSESLQIGQINNAN